MQSRRRSPGRVVFVLLAALVCLVCGGEPDREPAAYEESGDLAAILEQGTLRILTPPVDPSSLPRRGYTLDFEIELAKRFARSLGIRAVVLTIPERDKMLEALLKGLGDVVVAGITVTEERREPDTERTQSIITAGVNLLIELRPRWGHTGRPTVFKRFEHASQKV